MFVCFNIKQVRFVKMVAKLGLIKPVKAGEVRHPITGNIEMVIQHFTVNRIINNVLHYIFRLLNDEESRMRFQRLVDCGVLKTENDKSGEELKQSADIAEISEEKCY